MQLQRTTFNKKSQALKHDEIGLIRKIERQCDALQGLNRFLDLLSAHLISHCELGMPGIIISDTVKT